MREVQGPQGRELTVWVCLLGFCAAVCALWNAGWMCKWWILRGAAELAAAEAAAAAAPAAGNDIENWAEREDPKSGRKYYFHKVTKVTQWAKPDGWDEYVAKQAANPAAAAAAPAAPASAGAAPAAEDNSGA
jgi:hypothetical protein